MIKHAWRCWKSWKCPKMESSNTRLRSFKWTKRFISRCFSQSPGLDPLPLLMSDFWFFSFWCDCRMLGLGFVFGVLVLSVCGLPFYRTAIWRRVQGPWVTHSPASHQVIYSAFLNSLQPLWDCCVILCMHSHRPTWELAVFDLFIVFACFRDPE